MMFFFFFTDLKSVFENDSVDAALFLSAGDRDKKILTTLMDLKSLFTLS